ncbi:DUF5652 family protein [Candidatus Parcubacteria bacterium]|nr:DUF5652 family protein [Candidatus Parcubacteria bacterium]
MAWGPIAALGIVGVSIFLLLLAVWSIFWKGWALWRAARKMDKLWFVILLLVNTAGILDIIYIYWISKRDRS